MRIIQEPQYDFNDVLLLPKRSTLKSRKDVHIERTFEFKHTGKTWSGVPVIAANMLTGSFAMAKALAKHNMLTALHKHHSVSDLLNFWYDNSDIAQKNVFYTLGISDRDLQKYNTFCSEGIRPEMVCIDAASAHLEIFVNFLKKFRECNPTSIIMAGNVATGDMAEELILSGADIVKCGISGGGNCLTRRQTGIGRPMLSTIIETADSAHGLKGLVTADGGCVYPGDLFKAFCASSDFVMVGTMFAGTDECDGEVVEQDGKRFKEFFGMSSDTAMQKFYGGRDNYKASEGRTTLIPCKGSVDVVVEEILGGLRSGLSYIGAEKLKEASKRATFIVSHSQLNRSVEQNTIGK